MCLSLKGRFKLLSESFFMTLLYLPKKHHRRLLKRSNPLFFQQMAHVASTAGVDVAVSERVF